MNSRNFLLLVLVILVAGGILAYALGAFSNSGTQTNSGDQNGSDVLCAADVQQCPDGSYVPRVPPTCAFKACPSGTTATTTTSATSTPVTTAVLTTGTNTFLGTPITVSVVEDSRCPVDVQCIQAGTVRIKITMKGQTATLMLGKPQTILGTTITLVSVTPEKRSTVTIAPTDYRFSVSASEVIQ